MSAFCAEYQATSTLISYAASIFADDLYDEPEVERNPEMMDFIAVDKLTQSAGYKCAIERS